MEFIRKIKFNSPVVLIFVSMSFLAFCLSLITYGLTNRLFFSVYRSSFLDPLFYVRLFGHTLGHANWAHFSGNITMLLLLGPMLEEKYGSFHLSLIMIVTAVITGIINILIFPGTALLGASGIVYAFVLLSSVTSMKDGKIPVTFLLVATIYIGGQLFDSIFIRDNVSNLTHIIGGIIGAVYGYAWNRQKG